MDKFSEINSLASTGIKCNEKSYNITGVIYSCNNSHFSSSTCYKKDCINGLHSVINDDLYRLVNLKNKDNLDNQVCSFGEEKSKSYVYIILLESEEATTYMDNIIEEVEFKGGKSFDISLISGVFLIKLEYIILTLLILLIIYLLWNCNKIYHTDLIKNKTIQEFYIEN
jgi:hypothetical protein